MKLFQRLLVAPAALGLLSPISANANEVNLNDISNYSDIDSIEFANSFENKESTQSPLLAGGEGLVDSHNHHDGSFSTTTSAAFSADFVIGAVDGAGEGNEATTFEYQYGMDLTTSFTGEDSLDLTIETGNQAATTGSFLDLNANSDALVLDGIAYTFPLGDSLSIMVGDSTDISSVYSTACQYSAFTDLLGDCGTGNSAGIEGGTDSSGNDASSATVAASYDFGNGLSVAGGFSGAGGDADGLLTEESLDKYGVQVAYNSDSFGASVSYALEDTSATTETSFFGVNAFYSFGAEGLPSISVGFESEDPSATETEEGYFVGLSWDEFGPGTFSIGMSSVENYTDDQTEYYQYEAAYAYPVNDGMTITPGVFIQETAGDEQTGVVLKTSFSF